MSKFKEHIKLLKELSKTINIQDNQDKLMTEIISTLESIKINGEIK